MYLRTAAVLFALSATALWAQQTTITNPHTSPEDVAAGGRIFRAHCAVCHGPDGAGGRGAKLTRGEFRHATSDEGLYKIIADGIPGTEMPSTFFHGTQLWQVVSYVRSLSRRTPEASLTGSATAGKRVFSGKGGCQMCHMVDGEGGRLGPDLSLIGETRSAQHLRVSVLKPNAQIFPYDRSIRAVTRDGKTITGRRLNEDTHSVQLLDSQEKMVSLLKEEITKYEIIPESAMPSYEGKLAEGELDDLIAYLASLQRKRNP